MGNPDIPTEIWYRIASFIPEEDVLSLYPLNRVFFSLAMNARYRHVVLDNVSGNSSRSEFERKLEHLGSGNRLSFTRELTIKLLIRREDVTDYNSHRKSRAGYTIKKSISHLSGPKTKQHLPAHALTKRLLSFFSEATKHGADYRILSMSVSVVRNASFFSYYPPTFLDHIGKIMAACQTLQRICVDVPATYHGKAWRVLPIPILPHLTSLHIHIRGPGPYVWDKTWDWLLDAVEDVTIEVSDSAPIPLPKLPVFPNIRKLAVITPRLESGIAAYLREHCSSTRDLTFMIAYEDWWTPSFDCCIFSTKTAWKLTSLKAQTSCFLPFLGTISEPGPHAIEVMACFNELSQTLRSLSLHAIEESVDQGTLHNQIIHLLHILSQPVSGGVLQKLSIERVAFTTRLIDEIAVNLPSLRSLDLCLTGALDVRFDDPVDYIPFSAQLTSNDQIDEFYDIIREHLGSKTHLASSPLQSSTGSSPLKTDTTSLNNPESLVLEKRYQDWGLTELTIRADPISTAEIFPSPTHFAMECWGLMLLYDRCIPSLEGLSGQGHKNIPPTMKIEDDVLLQTIGGDPYTFKLRLGAKESSGREDAPDPSLRGSGESDGTP